MFNLGWGEIVIIGIVALIAIGPKELPTVLRTVGQWMGKVRRMANEFQGQFQEALREAELHDLKKHAEDISNSVNEQVTDIASFDPMAETQKDIEQAMTLPDLDAPAAQGAPALTDGEKLPASVLPEIEVPLPEAPTAVTEKDFAPAEPAAVPQEASREPPQAPPKQAGSGA